MANVGQDVPVNTVIPMNKMAPAPDPWSEKGKSPLMVAILAMLDDCTVQMTALQQSSEQGTLLVKYQSDAANQGNASLQSLAYAVSQATSDQARATATTAYSAGAAQISGNNSAFGNLTSSSTTTITMANSTYTSDMQNVDTVINSQQSANNLLSSWGN